MGERIGNVVWMCAVKFGIFSVVVNLSISIHIIF